MEVKINEYCNLPQSYELSPMVSKLLDLYLQPIRMLKPIYIYSSLIGRFLSSSTTYVPKCFLTAGQSFNIGPYGKICKYFFKSETKNFIKPKLYLNYHLIGLEYCILLLVFIGCDFNTVFYF